MIRIFLTGYMGAGKTTLGKAFARELNVPFIDLDWYIEERFHKSIRELFVERGEASFRELERNMLHEVSEFEDVIISTGGGTPCFFDNMDYMTDTGKPCSWMYIPIYCSTVCGWQPISVPSCRERRTRSCAPLLRTHWRNAPLSMCKPATVSMQDIWKADGRLPDPCSSCVACWAFNLL